MKESLIGKVALITGGTTGIGLVVAQQLAARGVRVAMGGRDQLRGEAAVRSIGDVSKALFVQTDVSDESQVQALVQQTVNHYGGIDFLFNNAGIEGLLGPLTTNTEHVLDQLLAINVKGVLLTLKHVLPHLIERTGGIIVNTASFVGTTVPFPDAVAYGATKAAVLSITRSVALGYANDQIQVYAVCPWITDTPMVDRLTGHQSDAKAAFGSSNPSGRIATPEDIAHVVLSLFFQELDLQSGDAVLVDSGAVWNKIHHLSA
ncbi:SDR family NAD(P)-dependent oxidoreductase [Larkinella insperata]|uniref:SDR family NAD(P)-dependent oxidoreductase n=1 Tax=Larkinella insperata TaxID=332158 RepID=A0ABW3QL49_9BACT